MRRRDEDKELGERIRRRGWKAATGKAESREIRHYDKGLREGIGIRH